MQFESLIGPIIGGCFTAIFGIIGVILIVKSVRDKKKADASSAWPATRGTILESTIVEHVSHDMDDHHQRSYEAVVHYEYEVMGTRYESKKLAFGSAASGSHRSAQEVVARYAVGSQVDVYYDPNDPKQAVLLREARSSKVMLILGIVFVGVSLCVGCVGGSLWAVSVFQ